MKKNIPIEEASEVSEAELKEIFQKRRKDRERWKGRRQKQLEASPPALSTLITNLLKKNPAISQKWEEAQALQFWNTLLGNKQGEKAYSYAKRLHRQILIIEVTNPLWMQNLFFFKSELLKKYRKKFPTLKLKDIHFYLRSQ